MRAGRFDAGRMWTFEYAPAQYFSETYGFAADSAWFARARLAALRIPGCSASFVSPNGLIATNHHCARGGVAAVSRPGENLLDNGFYAATLDAERRVPGFYADQLVAIEDVSDSVLATLDRARSDDERAQGAARTAFAAAAERVLGRYRAPGDSVFVQVISLYNGGRYSGVRLPALHRHPRRGGARTGARASSAATPTTSPTRATTSTSPSCGSTAPTGARCTPTTTSGSARASAPATRCSSHRQPGPPAGC